MADRAITKNHCGPNKPPDGCHLQSITNAFCHISYDSFLSPFIGVKATPSSTRLILLLLWRRKQSCAYREPANLNCCLRHLLSSMHSREKCWLKDLYAATAINPVPPYTLKQVNVSVNQGKWNDSSKLLKRFFKSWNCNSSTTSFKCLSAPIYHECVNLTAFQFLISLFLTNSYFFWCQSQWLVYLDSPIIYGPSRK